MTISQALILGIVQGLTEFFPISSSGHLVVLQSLFGLKGPQLAFDIFLHLGTLLSVLIFFHKDILGLFGKSRKMLAFLAIASIPTAIIGFIFKDTAERFFAVPRIVGYMLLVTGAWLTLASAYSRYAAKLIPEKKLGVAASLLIGIAQGAAVMPGISRSGSTISTGIMSGLDRELSFRFSLLLSLPAILGAALLKAHEIALGVSVNDPDSLAIGRAGLNLPYLLGAVVAMLTGLCAIKVLLNLVRNKRLYLFGIYCFLAGASVIILIR